MISLLGIIFGALTIYLTQWYSFRIWGDGNQLGILMVYCRKSKWTRWLVWNIWGNDDWHLNNLEVSIAAYVAWRKSCR